MTWSVVVGLTLGTFAFRWVGVTLLADRNLPDRVQEGLRLLPAALMAGLVSSQTFATGAALTVDARFAGILAAALAVLLRAPLIVVLVVALAVTALVRATGLAA